MQTPEAAKTREHKIQIKKYIVGYMLGTSWVYVHQTYTSPLPQEPSGIEPERFLTKQREP